MSEFLNIETFKRAVEGWMGGVLLHKCGGTTSTMVGNEGWALRCSECGDQGVDEILAEGEKYIRANYFLASKHDLEGIEKLELVDGQTDNRPTTYYRVRPATPLEKLEYLKRGALWAEQKSKEEAP